MDFCETRKHDCITCTGFKLASTEFDWAIVKKSTCKLVVLSYDVFLNLALLFHADVFMKVLTICVLSYK